MKSTNRSVLLAVMITLLPVAISAQIGLCVSIGSAINFGSESPFGMRVALESGVSPNTSGLSRWSVRRTEIGYLSEANDGSEPYPELTPKIAFAPPVLVPIRSRAEGNVDVTDRFSVQAGAEIGLCFLLF